MVSSNINWVETAELKAVKIDKDYGKKETYISLILMGIVAYLVMMILFTFITFNYGEMIISNIKNIITKGNLFSIMLYTLSALTLGTFLALVLFSVKGINKTMVGINHQVNTKDNYIVNIVSLIMGSIFIIILLVLTIFRIISYNVL